jgi:uncharacterized protein YjbJ (UPF0337 family)
MWNQDEIEGKAKQAKGAVKDKFGEWADNPTLEEEGEAEHTEGKLQETAGKAKRKLKEFTNDVKDKLADD